MSSLDVIKIQAASRLVLYNRRLKEKEEYGSQLEYYQTHPLEFIVERLGVRRETIDWACNDGYESHKWDGTPNPIVAILDSLVGKKWTGVQSATGTGKTFIGACIVRWFLECFENSIVVTTAPKEAQLKLHIWKELSKLNTKKPFGEYLSSLKLRAIPGKDEWLAVGFVAGVVASEDSTTKAQGFHAEHMLIILEETPGIPNPVITALQNTCTADHNIILAFGNPDHQMDNLNVFCNRSDVTTIRISAYDHPNVVCGDEIVPGAASMKGINRIIEKYKGKTHPMAKSRTQGICPEQGTDSLIRIEWIKAIQESVDSGRISEEYFKVGRPALGVDVANSDAGDEAAITEGVGAWCEKVESFPCADSNQLGKKKVAKLAEEKGVLENYIGVDGVGVGAGTVNALREIEIDCVNLIGGASPIYIPGQVEDFNNLRSQMWWQAREDISNGKVYVPKDPELIVDLTTPRYEETDKLIKVESKEKFKKRIGRSPNKGDAYVYWNWVRNGDRQKPTEISIRTF